MMEREFNVYIRIDSDKNIIACNSDAFLQSIEGWIKIDSGCGFKYMHSQNNYFPRAIYNDYWVPRYKYIDGEIIERTEEDMEKSRPTLATPLYEKIDKYIDMCEKLQESVDKIKTFLKI